MFTVDVINFYSSLIEQGFSIFGATQANIHFLRSNATRLRRWTFIRSCKPSRRYSRYTRFFPISQTVQVLMEINTRAVNRGCSASASVGIATFASCWCMVREQSSGYSRTRRHPRRGSQGYLPVDMRTSQQWRWPTRTHARSGRCYGAAKTTGDLLLFEQEGGKRASLFLRANQV